MMYTTYKIGGKHSEKKNGIVALYFDGIQCTFRLLKA